MRKSKRFAALALVAGLAVMAAACGSDDKKSEDTAAATTAAAGASTTRLPARARRRLPAARRPAAASTAPTCWPARSPTPAAPTTRASTRTRTRASRTPRRSSASKGELLESKSDADYAPNINQFLQKKCNLIVVRRLPARPGPRRRRRRPTRRCSSPSSTRTPTTTTARRTTAPTTRTWTNVRALTFSSEQPSFLAGYLAAGMSKSGTVATYGGINIPPVTSFMNGFLQGVNKYNEVHGTKVKVLGWDGKDGSFTEQLRQRRQGQAAHPGLRRRGRGHRLPGGRPGRPGHLGAGQGDPASSASSASTSTSTCRTRAAVGLPHLGDQEDRRIGASTRSATSIQTGKVGADYVGHPGQRRHGPGPVPRPGRRRPAALTDEIAQLKQDIISGKITVTA